MVGRHLFPLSSDDEIEDFEKKIQYRFIDRALLREALQASAPWNNDGNKILALVGDRVLDLVIVISGRKRNKPRGKCVWPWLVLFYRLTPALRRDIRNDQTEGWECLSYPAGIRPRH